MEHHNMLRRAHLCETVLARGARFGCLLAVTIDQHLGLAGSRRRGRFASGGSLDRPTTTANGRPNSHSDGVDLLYSCPVLGIMGL